MLSAKLPGHVFNRCFLSATAYLKSHINSFLSNKTPSFQLLLQSHALIITSGNAGNVFLSSKLISFYASFNQNHCSTKIFELARNKDTFLWNSIVQSHFSNRKYSEAFELYMQMRLHNTPPTQFTIPMVVSSCAELLWLKEGETVHGLATKSGLFLGNSAVSSSFMYMYAKCGVMDYASRIFEKITERDVVSWTALIIGYVHNGESEMGLECLCQMHRNDLDGENINFRTLEGGFQACVNLGALVQGRCLHGFAVKTGLGCWQAIQSSLLLVYSKFGSIEEACRSFSEMDNKDLFSWTSIIGLHVRLGLMNDCMALFWDMLAADNYPDEIFMSCMLVGFGNSSRVDEGKSFHCLIIRRNFTVDQMVADALLSMYCKFGLIRSAEKLFYGLNKRNEESWNSMVCGFAKAGREDKCIDLFRGMQKLGFKPNSNSLVSVLTSCSQLRETSFCCCSLHCYIIKNLMEGDISIVNSLIDTYGKDGNFISARRIFCGRDKDIVTWNTMIAAYNHSKCFTEAISLFDEMMLKNVKPNTATLATVLSACSQVADLEKGEKVHHLIKNDEDIELNVSLSTALVNMYAKCGQLEKSREIFNAMKDRDTISWNVMIAGYAMHGDTESAIKLFKQMEQSNVVPNSLTFLHLLSACAHSGFVDEGKLLFNRMKKYSVIPTLKHYTCIVDLLGRSGNLLEAEKLVLSMPVRPDGGVWGALLSACKMHDDIETGTRIAKEAIKADPRNDGYYLVMSDMYSSIGRWKEAEEAREMMKERGIEKRAGWSLV